LRSEQDIVGSRGIKRKNIIAGICFFLSGCAGLIYEVCWIRKASLVFGSTSYALSTVLAVFFLGIAIGSYSFGRISQRTSRPLKLFALMELAVGILALASPFSFEILDSVYGMAYRAAGGQFAIRMLVRFGLISVILLPPTILMGGTLPLFCRQYVNDEARIARSVGFLYGLNTLGAALGCAVTGLVLLPAFGMFGSICVGVSLNVLVALTAGFLGLRAQALSQNKTPKRRSGATRGHAAVSALLFLTGFVALGNEVLWARHMALLVRNTIYTYTLTLSAVLIGIVLGSAAAGFRFDRSKSRAFWFGSLQVAIGLLTLGLMLIPADFWYHLEPLPLSTYFFLLVPPAVLSGAAFPLGIRLVLADPAFAGVSVGRLAAVNTIGGIAGSLVVGFALLPLFGQQSTLLFTTGLSLAGGLIAWIVLERSFSPAIRWAAVSVSLVVWLLVPIAAGTHLPEDFLVNKKKDDHLIAYREGLSSNLAVVQRPQGERVLEINRLWQGQDRKNHQIMAAHVPMLLRSDPHSVLLVGAGAGLTASRFLMYSIGRLDCVDIEPAVFDVIREYFPSAWMDDGRVRLLREDGRNYLAHTRELYDVISIEVGQISRPGVPFFYTAEFYERASRRLTPGGFIVQFVPLPFFPVGQFRSVVATFLDTFPQSFLWYNTEEMLLIGVKTPKLKLSGERLALLKKDPGGDNEVRHDLRITLVGDKRYGMHQLPVFLGSFIAGPRGLADLSSGAPLYHDDRPVLDYAVSEVTQKDTNEIPIVALLRNHLDPVGEIIDLSLDNAGQEMITQVREKNLDHIVETALRRRDNVMLQEQMGQRTELTTPSRLAIAALPSFQSDSRGRTASSIPFP
jgi:spermidine synthase